MQERTPSEVICVMGDIADLMLADIDRVVADMDATEVGFYPEVAADPGLVADTSASNRANLVRLLTTWTRREEHSTPVDLPPEALDLARAIARRGFDFDIILHSYRRGQNVAWRHFMAHATRVVPSGANLTELLEEASQRLFEYVDTVLGRVIAVAQREREEIIGGALSQRAETVRMILDAAPVDAAVASDRLEYDLTRWHTGVVLWTEPRGGTQGDMEFTAGILARAIGASQLLLSVGPSTLWAWLRTDRERSLENLRDAMALAAPSVSVAVGPTRSGMAGFRASHAAARSLQALLIARRDGPQRAIHHDLEVAALVAQDHGRVKEFVAETLGALAADTPAAARLRDTLRVYLDEAENAPRTAVRLHMHRNTVRQRVASATSLLGRAPGERRLATELALELAHQIGPPVLTGP